MIVAGFWPRAEASKAGFSFMFSFDYKTLKAADVWLKGGAALAAQEGGCDTEDYLPPGAQQEAFPDVTGVYEVRSRCFGDAIRMV
jgi:hypothetical protein